MLAKGFSTPELQNPELPGAPSWFPLPAGWTLLGIMLLLALLFILIRASARFRRNRWRREARRQLPIQNADSWLKWIKRIMLIHHQRDTVSQWQSPAELLSRTPLDEDLRILLCSRYCQHDNQLDKAANQRISFQLTRWLESLPHV